MLYRRHTNRTIKQYFMKTHFLALLLMASMIGLSSCGKEVPPVFEVYVTFLNAEGYDQIAIDPNYIRYGALNHETKRPSGGGTLFFDRDIINILKEKFLQKTFLTSVSKSIGSVEYLALDITMILEKQGITFTTLVNNNNGTFPVDFAPENGEAYELNFVIDIKNSLIKNGDLYDFVLGGDSKVIITKY